MYAYREVKLTQKSDCKCEQPGLLLAVGDHLQVDLEGGTLAVGV